MAYFWFILLALFVVCGLITLLHIRVRLTVQAERKTLFVGLGRTGILTNYADKTRSILIAGRTIRTSAIEKKVAKADPKIEKPGKKSTRTRPFADIVTIIPDSFRAVRKYVISIVKSIIIEEFEVEVKAGLPDPHLTGIALGYYQAAVGAVPFMGKYFKFAPDWNEGSVSGSLKSTASIPLYKIIYRTTVLVFSLPLRKLIKLAIGRKVGYPNGRAK